MAPQSLSFSRRLAWPALLAIPLLAAACGRSDADTAAAVQAQLAKDPVTAPLNLGVAVNRGVAVISGATQSLEEQARASKIAASVVGVSEVVNAMEISEDARLAGAVKDALAADPALASVPIDVDSSNGLVRLMSEATDAAQRERAVSVARSVEGVKDVEDRMK